MGVPLGAGRPLVMLRGVQPDMPEVVEYEFRLVCCHEVYGCYERQVTAVVREGPEGGALPDVFAAAETGGVAYLCPKCAHNGRVPI